MWWRRFVSKLQAGWKQETMPLDGVGHQSQQGHFADNQHGDGMPGEMIGPLNNMLIIIKSKVRSMAVSCLSLCMNDIAKSTQMLSQISHFGQK